MLSCCCAIYIRLVEVIHSNKKLVLVFEFVDMDLKKFFSQFQREKGMETSLVKVKIIINFSEFALSVVEGHPDLSPIENPTQRLEASKSSCE